MKNNIILIIEGSTKTKSGSSKEFVGAASTREQAFKVCQEQSKRELFEFFQISKYNLFNNTYIGSSEHIVPYQEYTDDGHLTPFSKRVNGKCLTGLWGPYCGECQKTFGQELNKSIKNLSSLPKNK